MSQAAADLASGKGHNDENFPVASFLLHPRHRAPILAFYRFARVADDVADSETAHSLPVQPGGRSALATTSSRLSPPRARAASPVPSSLCRRPG